ncbi:MAG: oligosaccharide flippase family protein [Oscillospiraceae bacterium]|nr:oligosaccharide flippase family protein [Oscillospiraceae bacterium]
MSFFLQGMGLLFNILTSRKLGTASVGVMNLIFAFFGFIMILAGGNIFLSTSRLVSEELGAGNLNCRRIMRYAMSFSLFLSCFFAALFFIFADMVSVRLAPVTLGGADPKLAAAIRIIALSLPLGSMGACIKGYFHAKREVKVPMSGDFTEFTVRWAALISCLMLYPDVSIYLILAFAILVGEIASCCYLIIKYLPEYAEFSALPSGNPNIKRGADYLKLSLPISLSGYVQMSMSLLNEALVPVVLLKYNLSAERALSEYGMFEAMILPAMFFPALILGSLSNVIIPEIARANSAGNAKRVEHLVKQALTKAGAYSVLIAMLFFVFGGLIGGIICPSDPLVGDALTLLAPIIPFIYLEIVLEGILKGLGKQNFSTLNSLCEYTVRILCLIIFAHFYGFWGVIISYYASNIASNIARLIVVYNSIGKGFSFTRRRQTV